MCLQCHLWDFIVLICVKGRTILHMNWRKWQQTVDRAIRFSEP